MDKRFIGIWSNQADVARDFCDDRVLEYDILIAAYEDEEYEGDSYVLAKKGGVLYENEAGHCSCAGLEGGWNPTEISLEYLANRVFHGSFSLANVVEPIKKMLMSHM